LGRIGYHALVAEQVQAILVDISFNGVFQEYLAQRYNIPFDKSVHVLVTKTNFRLHAWHGIFERIFNWLRSHRRLAKKYDRIMNRVNAWFMPTHICRILKFY
jgi:esterase/lipase